MSRVLKAVMVVNGVIHVLLGLIDITMHELMAKMYGFTAVAPYVNWMGEIIGALFIAMGVWTVLAARDPLRHILWLKFLITASGLVLAVSVHSVLVDYVGFSQIGRVIFVSGAFFVAFLALYPWHTARNS